jgi:dimethylamine/trimethylamine dehydrogenase
VRRADAIVHEPAASHPDRPTRFDTLFDQIKIGPKVMRNRFYATPHAVGLGAPRPRAHAGLRGMKAEGGWAVVNTEYCSIHPECDDSPEIPSRLWDDDDVRALNLMTDKVHEHGALAGVELWYGGAVGTNLETRLAARGVSQTVNDQFRMHSCYAMTQREIHELQGFYVAAARRAVAAGFDIVILGAQEVDNIFMQFLMAFYNRRTDAYGGSLANRARFLLETGELVREAVSDHCAVAIRLCIDTLDGSENGMRAAVEGVEVVAMADDLVDYWDVQAGGWGAAHWGEDAVPSRFSDENFQGEYIRAVRPATDKPLVGVGRFTSPDTMVALIRSGQQDLIGGARPSISDPFLPAKVQEGRFDEIRECIGCNICVSRIDQGVPIICTQNPTLGEEYRRGWHPEHVPQARNVDAPVLIVGAGPAGLECAVTLGKRGFDNVHVVDAEPKPGGALRWIATLPGLAEWVRVLDYRLGQIDRLPNVTLVPRRKLDVDDVLDYGGRIVIAATGSRWCEDGLNWATHRPTPGADASLAHVLTPEQLVEGKPVDGERVLIYDCDGYFMGPSLAEKLVREGKHVTVVTPFPDLAPAMEHTFEAANTAERLYELGVELELGMVIDQVGPGSVELSRVVRRDRRTTLDADAVVLVTERRSDDDWYRELEAEPAQLADAGITALFRIGDCVVPRLVADAVFDGHRLAREIDSPQPATPLPFLRERPAI